MMMREGERRAGWPLSHSMWTTSTNFTSMGRLCGHLQKNYMPLIING